MATKSRFTNTPGPWKREPGQRFKLDHSAGVLGPDGLYIASALDFNREDKDPEVEANARLIAAAPDLLAALEHLYESASTLRETVLERVNAETGYTTVPRLILMDAKALTIPLEQAHAAIAKAKGS